MRKLKILPSPDCLNNEIVQSSKAKITFYDNLRYKDKIIPRWNTLSKDTDGISKIRKQLFKMSDGYCAYCGKLISIEEMDVDHYLPSSKYPYIAYCFNNYLPSCKMCNQTIKKDFVPNALKDKSVVESIVSNSYSYDFIYDKKNLLDNVCKNHRLIDPSYDNPEDHLVFNTEFYFYDYKTPIGKVTADMFFNKRKEVAENYEKVSLFIKDLVAADLGKEKILDFINLYGYEYVCLKFYEYWVNETREHRNKIS
jgi:uncharacterized protein (TIGR02646 family)